MTSKSTDQTVSRNNRSWNDNVPISVIEVSYKMSCKAKLIKKLEQYVHVENCWSIRQLRCNLESGKPITGDDLYKLRRMKDVHPTAHWKKWHPKVMLLANCLAADPANIDQ